jgi:uncharacterized membrane protein YfcA
MTQALLLVAAGFLAGTMNAVAGGGSFVTLPALMLSGLPSVTANASSTVALYPGSLASTWAYREGLTGFAGVRLAPLALTSVAGGVVGAVLLLATPEVAFDRIVPFLLLVATLTLAFGREAGTRLRRRLRIGPATVLPVQFALAVYGGYFGGAVGIMMMAVWGLLSEADLKAMNPAKTLMVAAANTVAVLCFALAGAVAWPETLAVLVSGAVGGWLGAKAALRMDPRHIRLGVTLIAAAMTVAFFLRAP